MPKIRVVIVEPKYQQNLGYIARTMKNFGVFDLVLVNPRCKYTGQAAIKYSKHAKELLQNARIATSLKSAVNGLVIGTTGAWRKADNSFYNIANLSKLRKKPSWKNNKQITLVIGRDDVGLNKEEVRECDAMVFVGTNPDYPILNISHALAIMLYEFTMQEFSAQYKFLDDFNADEKYQKRLVMLFDRFVRQNDSVRNKVAVSGAFRRILKRSMPTKMEINAIAAALSEK